jgi:hypothetical protein
MNRHFEDDPELESLMRQALQSRTLEKDYQSLEQQIRCLKLRRNTQADDEYIEKTQSYQQQSVLNNQVEALEQELQSLHH